ncbi:MAG: hypothetical protein FRX49_07401 [Trebouxia sp. A1-2]|nr:MAG: hypothetical protein FRX49_07401 [Trebouxia sp. A1-2]
MSSTRPPPRIPDWLDPIDRQQPVEHSHGKFFDGIWGSNISPTGRVRDTPSPAVGTSAVFDHQSAVPTHDHQQITVYRPSTDVAPFISNAAVLSSATTSSIRSDAGREPFTSLSYDSTTDSHVSAGASEHIGMYIICCAAAASATKQPIKQPEQSSIRNALTPDRAELQHDPEVIAAAASEALAAQADPATNNVQENSAAQADLATTIVQENPAAQANSGTAAPTWPQQTTASLNQHSSCGSATHEDKSVWSKDDELQVDESSSEQRHAAAKDILVQQRTEIAGSAALDAAGLQPLMQEEQERQVAGMPVDADLLRRHSHNQQAPNMAPVAMATISPDAQERCVAVVGSQLCADSPHKEHDAEASLHGHLELQPSHAFSKAVSDGGDKADGQISQLPESPSQPSTPAHQPRVHAHQSGVSGNQPSVSARQVSMSACEAALADQETVPAHQLSSSACQLSQLSMLAIQQDAAGHAQSFADQAQDFDSAVENQQGQQQQKQNMGLLRVSSASGDRVKVDGPEDICQLAQSLSPQAIDDPSLPDGHTVALSSASGESMLMLGGLSIGLNPGIREESAGAGLLSAQQSLQQDQLHELDHRTIDSLHANPELVEARQKAAARASEKLQCLASRPLQQSLASTEDSQTAQAEECLAAACAQDGSAASAEDNPPVVEAGHVQEARADQPALQSSFSLCKLQTHLTEEHGELGPALVDLSSSQQSSPDVTAAGAVQQALDAGMTMDKTDAEALDVGSVDEACAEAHHVEVNEPFVAFASLNSDVASGLNPNLDLGTRQLDSDKREPAFADGQLGPDKGQPKVGDGQPNVSNQSVLPMLQLDVSDGLPGPHREQLAPSAEQLQNSVEQMQNSVEQLHNSPEQPLHCIVQADDAGNAGSLWSAQSEPQPESLQLEIPADLQMLDYVQDQQHHLVNSQQHLPAAVSSSLESHADAQQACMAPVQLPVRLSTHEPAPSQSQSSEALASSTSELPLLHPEVKQRDGGGLSPLRLCSQLLSHLSVQSPCLQSPGLQQPDSFQLQSAAATPRCASALLQLYPGLEQLSSDVTRDPRQLCLSLSCSSRQQPDELTKTPSTRLQTYPGLERPGALQRQHQSESASRCQSGVLQSYPGLEQRYQHTETIVQSLSSVLQVSPGLEQPGRQKMQQSSGTSSAATLEPPLQQCSRLETAAVSKAQQALGDKADQPLQPPESVCSALSSQPDSMYPGLEPAAPSWAQYKQQQGTQRAQQEGTQHAQQGGFPSMQDLEAAVALPSQQSACEHQLRNAKQTAMMQGRGERGLAMPPATVLPGTAEQSCWGCTDAATQLSLLKGLAASGGRASVLNNATAAAACGAVAVTASESMEFTVPLGQAATAKAAKPATEAGQGATMSSASVGDAQESAKAVQEAVESPAGSAHAASGAAPFRQTTDSVTEALHQPPTWQRNSGFPLCCSASDYACTVTFPTPHPHLATVRSFSPGPIPHFFF